jgi:dsDNA-specific endonuclease/ATPase MutS2
MAENWTLAKQASQAQREIGILRKKTVRKADEQIPRFIEAARNRIRAARHGVELGRTDARRILRQSATRISRAVSKYIPKIPKAGMKVFGFGGQVVKAMTDITLKEQAKRRARRTPGYKGEM